MLFHFLSYFLTTMINYWFYIRYKYEAIRVLLKTKSTICNYNHGSSKHHYHVSVLHVYILISAYIFFNARKIFSYSCLLLLQQVQSKVSFPKEPKVSSLCKNLINKILAPYRNRLRIGGIRADSWFSMQTSPSTSSAQVSKVNARIFIIFSLLKFNIYFSFLALCAAKPEMVSRLHDMIILHKLQINFKIRNYNTNQHSFCCLEINTF